MHVTTSAEPAERQIISGFGLGAGAVLVIALILMATLGLVVGFDRAAWAASSGPERFLAGGSFGAASGSLFCLIADLVRQAMR